MAVSYTSPDETNCNGRGHSVHGLVLTLATKCRLMLLCMASRYIAPETLRRTSASVLRASLTRVSNALASCSKRPHVSAQHRVRSQIEASVPTINATLLLSLMDSE